MKVLGCVIYPLTQPTTQAETDSNTKVADFGLILTKLDMEVQNGV